MPAILLLFAVLAAVNIEGTAACKLDLLFLIDGSSTICEGHPADDCPNWKSLIEFIKNIVRSLTIGPDDTKVAFLKYGNEAHVGWNLNQYKDKTQLLAAIDGETLPGGELTSTDSFSVVVTEVFNATVGDRSDAPNVGILISDDASVTEEAGATASAALQKAANLKLLLVGATERVPESRLAAVSSPPHEKGVTYFVSKEYNVIDDVRASLEAQLCPS